MNETVKTWRVLDILKVTENAFAERGIKNARLNAELLLCDTTGDKRIDLYLNFEKPLNDIEISAYREKVKRRLKYEPLQYILGKAEFYGLSFKVTPDVLIPRPETELLVDLVLDHIKTNKLEAPGILEIGTGSGCISTAIAANCECKIDAIDISKEVLTIAEENSQVNGTVSKINFIQKDFLDSINTFSGYEIIVSNPPYIAAIDIAGLNEEVKNFEPFSALSDNKDGLSFYRRFFGLIVKSKANQVIFLEIGDGKKDAITALLKEFKIENHSFYNDLINFPRVLKIEIKG